MLVAEVGVCEWGILISGAYQTYRLAYSPWFSLVVLTSNESLPRCSQG